MEETAYDSLLNATGREFDSDSQTVYAHLREILFDLASEDADDMWDNLNQEAKDWYNENVTLYKKYEDDDIDETFECTIPNGFSEDVDNQLYDDDYETDPDPEEVAELNKMINEFVGDVDEEEEEEEEIIVKEVKKPKKEKKAPTKKPPAKKVPKKEAEVKEDNEDVIVEITKETKPRSVAEHFREHIVMHSELSFAEHSEWLKENGLSANTAFAKSLWTYSIGLINTIERVGFVKRKGKVIIRVENDE